MNKVIILDDKSLYGNNKFHFTLFLYLSVNVICNYLSLVNIGMIGTLGIISVDYSNFNINNPFYISLMIVTCSLLVQLSVRMRLQNKKIASKLLWFHLIFLPFVIFYEIKFWKNKNIYKNKDKQPKWKNVMILVIDTILGLYFLSLSFYVIGFDFIFYRIIYSGSLLNFIPLQILWILYSFLSVIVIWNAIIKGLILNKHNVQSPLFVMYFSSILQFIYE